MIIVPIICFQELVNQQNDGSISQLLQNLINFSSKSEHQTWIIEPNLIYLTFSHIQKLKIKNKNPQKILIDILEYNGYEIISKSNQKIALIKYTDGRHYPYLSISGQIHFINNLKKCTSQFRQFQERIRIVNNKYLFTNQNNLWQSIGSPTTNSDYEITSLSTEQQNNIVNYGISAFFSDSFRNIDSAEGTIDKFDTTYCTIKKSESSLISFVYLNYQKDKIVENLPLTYHLSLNFQRFMPNNFDLSKLNLVNRRELNSSTKEKSVFITPKQISDISLSDKTSPKVEVEKNILSDPILIFGESYSEKNQIIQALSIMNGYQVLKIQDVIYIESKKPRISNDINSLSKNVSRIFPESIKRFYQSFSKDKLSTIYSRSALRSEFEKKIDEFSVLESAAISSTDFSKNQDIGFKPSENTELQYRISNWLFLPIVKEAFLIQYKEVPSFLQNPPTGTIYVRKQKSSNTVTVEVLGLEKNGYAFSISY